VHPYYPFGTDLTGNVQNDPAHGNSFNDTEAGRPRLPCRRQAPERIIDNIIDKKREPVARCLRAPPSRQGAPRCR
jgi:hypothetical protein